MFDKRSQRVAVGLLVEALVLDEEGHRVDAEALDAELQPVAHDAQDLLAHLRVGDVEVGLELVEAVHVPRARLFVVGPHRLLHAGEDDPLGDVGGLLLRPDVPVALGRGGIARGLEPGVIHRGVVDHEIHQELHAPLARGAAELHEVPEVAVARIDAVEVGDVVAVVAVGRGVERVEPQRRDAQRLQMVEPVGEAAEVARPVAVRVHEGLDVQAVEDGVLVPQIDHDGPLTQARMWGRGPRPRRGEARRRRAAARRGGCSPAPHPARPRAPPRRRG